MDPKDRVETLANVEDQPRARTLDRRRGPLRALSDIRHRLVYYPVDRLADVPRKVVSG
jgi:hypothetical protein